MYKLTASAATTSVLMMELSDPEFELAFDDDLLFVSFWASPDR